MAAPLFANKVQNLFLRNEETCLVDSKHSIDGHSTFGTPELFHHTFKPSISEHTASESLKLTKIAASTPNEGPAMASHPSSTGDGARGFNSDSSPTKTFFLRKNRSPHCAQLENGHPSSTPTFSTAGSTFSNSPPSTIRPSAVAPAPHNLATTNDSRTKEQMTTVHESVLDRLLEATRPISPSNPGSALELLKYKYEVCDGMLRAEELAEPLNNDPAPGPICTESFTSAAEQAPLNEGASPKFILDLYGNAPNAKLEVAYLFSAWDPVSSGPSARLLLAPAPIIYEGSDEMKPFAHYRAKFTYRDRYSPPEKPVVPLPESTHKQLRTPKAIGSTGIISDMTLPTNSTKTTQGCPPGSRLLPRGQAHLDFPSAVLPGMPTRPLPPLPKVRPRSNAIRIRRDAPLMNPRVPYGDAPALPTSHISEEESFESLSEYDSAFFPSLPPRKGTPPPACFGRGVSEVISTLPETHSSPPHSIKKCDDIVQGLMAGAAVFTKGHGGSEWQDPPSWDMGKARLQRSYSSSSDIDLAHIGTTFCGSSDSPYSSVYFGRGSLRLSGEDCSDGGSTSSSEDGTTPKVA